LQSLDRESRAVEPEIYDIARIESMSKSPDK
jgi:hypothetical protein